MESRDTPTVHVGRTSLLHSVCEKVVEIMPDDEAEK